MKNNNDNKDPYIGYGNDTLRKQPTVRKGDTVRCKKCGGEHTLFGGTSNGEETELLLAYRCGTTTYLAAINNKLIMDIPPDCKGEL